MGSKRAPLLIIALIVCLTGVMLVRPQSRAEGHSGPVALVSALRGRVTITAPQKQARLAHRGDLLAAGYQVVTEKGATVTLIFARGDVVTLRESTCVTVGPAGTTQTQTAQGALRTLNRPQVSLDLGRIWLQIRKRLDGLVGFEVATPAATFAVRGTVFSVAVLPDNSTSVSVRSGVVEAYNELGRTLVDSGFAVLTREGEAPGGKEPFDDNELTEWQQYDDWSKSGGDEEATDEENEEINAESDTESGESCTEDEKDVDGPEENSSGYSIALSKVQHRV